MNIANPFKALALVGGLVLGVTSIKADGTWPLPIASEELPFVMSGTATETFTGTVLPNDLDLTMTLDQALPGVTIDPKLKARCRTDESFAPAAGSIQLADDLYDIKGICSPVTASATNKDLRQIVGTSSGRIISFDGSFVLDTLKGKTFKGKVLTIDSVVSTPESSATGPKTISFELTGL